MKLQKQDSKSKSEIVPRETEEKNKKPPAQNGLVANKGEQQKASDFKSKNQLTNKTVFLCFGKINFHFYLVNYWRSNGKDKTERFRFVGESGSGKSGFSLGSPLYCCFIILFVVFRLLLVTIKIWHAKSNITVIARLLLYYSILCEFVLILARSDQESHVLFGVRGLFHHVRKCAKAHGEWWHGNDYC